MVLKFLIASQHKFASAVRYRKEKKRWRKTRGIRKGEHNPISFCSSLIFQYYYLFCFTHLFPPPPLSLNPPKPTTVTFFVCERAFLQSKCWNECEEYWIPVWKIKDWKENFTEALNTVLDIISAISRLALLLLFLG